MPATFRLSLRGRQKVTAPSPWYAPLLGPGAVFTAGHPGDATSSAQRVEWVSTVASYIDTFYTESIGQAGLYWALAGNATNDSGYDQYYDGLVNRYAYAMMLGEGAAGTYKTRADAMGKNYADYLATTNVQAHHFFPESLLAHWLVTGDAASRTRLRAQSVVFIRGATNNGWPDAITSGSAQSEGRIVARFLLSALCCHKAGFVETVPITNGAYSRTYPSWLATAQAYGARIVANQLPDGSYDMGTAWRNGTGNFHLALMMDALWKLHLVAPDPSYVTCMANAAAYLKNTQFNSLWPFNPGALQYGQGIIAQNRRSDGSYFAVPSATAGGTQPDLGNLYGPLFHRTGDTAFARQLLGTNTANAYGTTQPFYGALGADGGNRLNANGFLTKKKQLNEMMWQAWEYMA